MISHGLQIGKDQEGDNHQDENGPQFDKGSSTLSQSLLTHQREGLRKLLIVVHEFMAWHGMQINVNKMYLLVIDNDIKRREQERAPLLTINAETL